MSYAEKVAGVWVEKSLKAFRAERNASIPLAALEAAGLFEIVTDAEPTITDEQVAERGSLADRNGQPVIGWTIRAKTSDELDADTVTTATAVRRKRTELLNDTDWTQLADAPADAATWATYRQALRDITKHPSFPHLSDNDWPE
jgi:hypothetical protein